MSIRFADPQTLIQDAAHTGIDSVSRVRLSVLDWRGRPGNVDGGWWPRTADLAVEAGPLLSMLFVATGPIERVIYNSAEWEPSTNRLSCHQRRVMLDGYHFHPRHTISLIGLDRTRWVLLVVPPSTDAAIAAVLLDAASNPYCNGETVPELLGLVLGDAAPFTDPRRALQRWDTDGGA